MTLLRTQTRLAELPVRYEKDPFAWALQQEAVLREGQADALDWPHLADEIADVARRERDRLTHVLERLVQQQLIWDYGSDAKTQSRAAAIEHQRRRVSTHLSRFPSLRRHRATELDRAYGFGRIAALRETGLAETAMPETNPYTWQQLMKPSHFRRSGVARVNDTHAWATRQSDLLRRRHFAELDLDKLADEIADVARRDYLRFRSALMQILQHLLKWDHQPKRWGRSWALSIAEHRERVRLLLAEHPSLAARRSEALEAAYHLGRIAALRETGLPEHALPDTNPYSWDIVVDRPIPWPDQSSPAADHP